MERGILYHRSFETFSRAFSEGVLSRRSSCGCAVGNLVAASLGYEIFLDNGKYMWWDPKEQCVVDSAWAYVFITNTQNILFVIRSCKQSVDMKELKDEALRQIMATGYSVEELMKIEFAFESGCNKKLFSEDRIFDGLCAVMDALDEIHKNIDLKKSTAMKQRFARIAQMV